MSERRDIFWPILLFVIIGCWLALWISEIALAPDATVTPWINVPMSLTMYLIACVHIWRGRGEA